MTGKFHVVTTKKVPGYETRPHMGGNLVHGSSSSTVLDDAIESAKRHLIENAKKCGTGDTQPPHEKDFDRGTANAVVDVTTVTTVAHTAYHVVMTGTAVHVVYRQAPDYGDDID